VPARFVTYWITQILSRARLSFTFFIIGLLAVGCTTATARIDTAQVVDTPVAPADTPVALAMATPTMEPTATPVPSPTPAVPTPTPIPPTPTPIPPTPTPTVDFGTIRPNELGAIPILAYHLIDRPDGRWSRSPENFRRDLERLYQNRYRLISLSDFVDNRIDVPAGFTPVVLTFDDSSPGQFRFIERDGQVVVDPESAVGILQQFYQEHPDFGRAATFFVLPAADRPHNLFGQDEYQEKKLRYLVENGMDIGNHSFWHQRLDIVDDEEVQHQLGRAKKILEEMVPGYTVDILSLPLGQWPKNRSLAFAGEWEGIRYQHKAVLLAGTDLTEPPGHVDFNPNAIQRIQAVEEVFDFWLEYLDRDPDSRFISDGNPDRLTVPTRLAAQVKPGLGNEVPSGHPDYQSIALR
jgi:hypothetical protein